jgi:hypothetical protein
MMWLGFALVLLVVAACAILFGFYLARLRQHQEIVHVESEAQIFRHQADGQEYLFAASQFAQIREKVIWKIVANSIIRVCEQLQQGPLKNLVAGKDLHRMLIVDMELVKLLLTSKERGLNKLYYDLAYDILRERRWFLQATQLMQCLAQYIANQCFPLGAAYRPMDEAFKLFMGQVQSPDRLVELFVSIDRAIDIREHFFFNASLVDVVDDYMRQLTDGSDCGGCAPVLSSEVGKMSEWIQSHEIILVVNNFLGYYDRFCKQAAASEHAAGYDRLLGVLHLSMEELGAALIPKPSSTTASTSEHASKRDTSMPVISGNPSVTDPEASVAFIKAQIHNQLPPGDAAGRQTNQFDPKTESLKDSEVHGQTAKASKNAE